jgi:hypothetical protein
MATVGLDREAIYAALLTRLQTVASLTQGVSRSMPQSWPPGPLEQPCAFIPASEEVPEYRANMPARWTLKLTVLVCAVTDQAGTAPSTLLAPLVKDIESALQWRAGDSFYAFGGPGTWTNLGGLCTHCCITGVAYAEGKLTGQGFAYLDLEILAEVKT